MFVLNDDNSIYVTRGDGLYFDFYADDNGKNYKFKPGDVLQISVAVKKDMSSVVLQKRFPVEDYTENVRIYLTKRDTRIGGVISKPTDYWYQIRLNPDDETPQSIVSYDEDGPKLFRLFPEAEEINEPDPAPEDIPIVDQELDMTSTRPVGNQAISRAYLVLLAGYERTHAAVAKLHVTPQMFGAIADGVADDTEAIQEAIDSGAVVVFPEGKYAFSDTLSLTGANISLDASKATLIYTGTDYGIVIDNMQDSILHIGQLVSLNGNGIKVISNSKEEYSQYIDVYFRAIKAKYNGVYADIADGWANEIRFHDGVFAGCDCGCRINSHATDECTAWKFFNISFEGCNTGLYLDGDTRFRDIELRSIRYGDDTNMVVVHVGNQVHNLKLDAAMPFYDSYFVVDEGAIVYNSEINAPIYNTNHALICRQRYYDSNGEAHDVGFIERLTQELFNDCAHASVTKHSAVTLSDPYCAYNSVVATFQTKVTCNSMMPAWAPIVTLPKEAMRVVGSCIYTYVPKMSAFIQLYVNTDGTITSAVDITSGSEFVIYYTAIRNQ